MDEAQVQEERDEPRWIAQRGKDEYVVEIQLLARLSVLPMDASQEQVDEVVQRHNMSCRGDDVGLEVNMLPSLAQKVATTILHEFLTQIAENVGDSDILYWHEPDHGTYGYFPPGFVYHTRHFLLAIDCEVAHMDNQRYYHDMAVQGWGPVIPQKNANRDAQITAWRRAMFKQALPLFRIMERSGHFTTQFIARVEHTAASMGLV